MGSQPHPLNYQEDIVFKCITCSYIYMSIYVYICTCLVNVFQAVVAPDPNATIPACPGQHSMFFKQFSNIPFG